MNASETAVKILLTFPPEVWASITHYVPGEDIGRLKLTGSKTLWSRLCVMRGVKSVILGKNWLNFKRWPAFINELPTVQELSIDEVNTQWWSDWNPKLDLVPSTLKKLRVFGQFECTGSFFLKNDGSAMLLSQYVPHLEELDVNQEWIPENIWMTSVPPTLVTLKILDWRIRDMPLPPTLTYLQAWSISVDSTENVVLPSGLEILKFSDTNSLSLLLLLLPPSIRELRTYFCDLAQNEMLMNLPRKLETLSAVSITGSGPISSSCLPSHLTKLNVALLSSDAWPYLPTTLKTLYLSSVAPTLSRTVTDPVTGETHSYTTAPIHTLPKSVTWLSLTFNEQIFIEDTSDSSNASNALNFTIFPPFLTYLEIHRGQLSVEAVKLLPASLLYLLVDFFDSSVCKHLPRGLLRLDSVDTIVSPDFLQTLPISLTSLSFYVATRNRSLIDPITRKLTTIAIESAGCKLDWSASARLLPNLTDLKLVHFAQLGDSFPFRSLQKLYLLNLNAATQITDFSIPLLSRHLIDLQINSSRGITGKCFPSLPRGLTHLDLNASADISDSDIQHLPRSLESLYLNNAIYLTNECIQHLPIGLNQFRVQRNQKINETILSALPRPIRLSKQALAFTSSKFSFSFGTLTYQFSSK